MADGKKKSNFLQNVFKRSMVSHADLSPATHTACGMVWYRTQTVKVTACGMVWYRTGRVKVTACGMVWYRTGRVKVAAVVWCGTGLGGLKWQQWYGVVQHVVWCGTGLGGLKWQQWYGVVQDREG